MTSLSNNAKRVAALALAFGSFAIVGALPGKAVARTQVTQLGCVDLRDLTVFVNLASAPRNCSLLFHQTVATGQSLYLGNTFQLWNVRWSNWGGRRAVGVGKVGLADSGLATGNRISATVIASNRRPAPVGGACVSGVYFYHSLTVRLSRPIVRYGRLERQWTVTDEPTYQC
jgi:hypothetical protein